MTTLMNKAEAWYWGNPDDYVTEEDMEAMRYVVDVSKIQSYEEIRMNVSTYADYFV
jgi:hypothetical protein